MIGETLGHYRIESKLGEGGMGVVYRAHDTRLDRPVAIKVLPAEAVNNPDRKLRFTQEAKSASALNHPHIVHIYDIDTVNDVNFIAMEYVPGKTLDQLIGRKGLGLAETLRYALQLADALAKAHAAGIVHRDLKPANIMVTPDGVVKVLDFGLAKLTESVDSGEFATTRTMRATEGPRTEEGTVVGTAAYMSPEQAEGKPVNARSDIFSFGSVLYEMITGQRAFQGTTKMSTLTAILRDEPKPVHELAENAPRDLEKVIIRCLRKDREYRFQHMDDLKVALREIKEESETGEASAPAPPRRRISPWIMATAAVAVITAAGFAWWWRTQPPAPQNAGEPILTRLTSDGGLNRDPALSPDGKLFAFASDRGGNGSLDIWAQQLAGGDPIRLSSDDADDIEPSFSPDGSKIAYRSDRAGGGIYVVSTLGGESRLVAKDGRQPRFSPDGASIAYASSDDPGNYPGKIYAVPSNGGPSRQLRPEMRSAHFPIWSPDGKRLLFFGSQERLAPSMNPYDWWVAPVEGGTAVKTGALAILLREKFSFRTIARDWLGNEIFFSAQKGDSTNLWQIAISPETWQITGAPKRLTFGSGMEVSPSVIPGRVVFSSLNSAVDIWSLPLDENRGKVVGEIKRLTQDPAVDVFPLLTPDGKKLVFASKRSGSEELWVKDLVTGSEKPLTAAHSPVMGEPVLDLDGSRVAYGARAAKYVVPTAGGVAEKLCDCPGGMGTWSRDGKAILTATTGPRGIQLIDVASGKQTLLLRHPTWDVLSPRFSPDDRSIAFTARTGPLTRRIYIAPFRPETVVEERGWIAVTEGKELDRGPHWSPDGSLIYYTSHRDGFRCIWAQRLDRSTKPPIGPAFPVHHFHRARLASRVVETSRIGLAMAAGKMVISLEELTGNIWSATLPAPK